MTLGQSLGEALRQANEVANNNKNDGHDSGRIHSGSRDLDQQLERLQFLVPGRLCELSGPSGSGKTSLAIQLVKSITSKGGGRGLWIDTVGVVPKEKFCSGTTSSLVDHVQVSSLSQLIAFIKYGLKISSDIKVIVIDNLTSATKMEPLPEDRSYSNQPKWRRPPPRNDASLQPCQTPSSSLSKFSSSSLSSSFYYTLSSPSTPRSKRPPPLPGHVYESHRVKIDRAVNELLVCLSKLADRQGLRVLVLTQMSTSFISTCDGLKPVLASSIRRQTARQAGGGGATRQNSLGAVNPLNHLTHQILIYPCRPAEKLGGSSARLCQLISYKQRQGVTDNIVPSTGSVVDPNSTPYCFLRLSPDGTISDISEKNPEPVQPHSSSTNVPCKSPSHDPQANMNDLDSSLRDYDYYEEAYGLGDPDTSYL